MIIKAISKNPQKLINAIDKAIKDEDLKTWIIVHNDKNENLYSHSPDQWNEKAIFKPHIYDDYVSFIMTWWKKNGEPDQETKGYILGRFIEILMVHFTNHFDSIEVKKD
jgi:hypothetical protein